MAALFNSWEIRGHNWQVDGATPRDPEIAQKRFLHFAERRQMASPRRPTGSVRGKPRPLRIVKSPVVTAAAKYRYSDQIARLSRMGVVAGAAAEHRSARRDAD